MSIGLERFRQAEGSRVVLNAPTIAQSTDVQKSEIGFFDRLGAAFRGHRTTTIQGATLRDSFSHGTVESQLENIKFKATFYRALVKAEGQAVADRAIRAAGLGTNWNVDGSALGDKKIAKILDKAQEFRMGAMRETQSNYKTFLRGSGTTPGSLLHTFNQQATANGYPITDGVDPKLHQMIRREIRQDPNYAKRTMTQGDLVAATNRAITKFYDLKQAGFREQHPGLAQFVQAGHGGVPREDNRSFALGLLTKLSTVTGGSLAGEPQPFRDLARDALKEVHGTTTLLAKNAFEPTQMRQLGNELVARFERLHDLENQLAALADGDAPQTAEAVDLQQALITDIRHQKDLLLAKAGMLDDLRANNPLTEKAVGYSNLLWAKAAEKIFDEAIEHVRANKPADEAGPIIQQLQTAKLAHTAQRKTAYDNASVDVRVEGPTKQNKKTHPAVQGKTDTVNYLQSQMRLAGIPTDVIDQLTGKKSLGDARRHALTQNPDWAPIRREMVLTKDGVTRSYGSNIIPGADISPRFARRYASDQPLEPGGPAHEPKRGTPSAEKADHYHARNLKVSELTRIPHGGGQPETIAKVIGHGVLDMWDIEDADERETANNRGGKEVLEAAICTNDRVRDTAIDRARAGDNRPVKIIHVSVNLTTPAPWRELPGARGTEKLHDYQEATYTNEQFRAFEHNSSAANGGNPIQFEVDDIRANQVGQTQDVPINVEVETITFSFGINPMATHASGGSDGAKFGAMQGALYGSVVPIAGTIVGAGVGALVGAIGSESVENFAGGWANVYEHNRGEMIKFIGDLGTGKDGAEGQRPGGFIGSVFDRLDPNVPQQAELMGKLRDQTDVVRRMFTNEDFRRGNGDPAKMGREILALQAYAEQVLDLLQVDDQAATMSKGCKSDKDRGGITDVELKHKLATEDMGGILRPDLPMSDEDLDNYYAVLNASGQQENQKLNTGQAGSKEAGKLSDRILDEYALAYSEGLGAFSSE